MCQSNDDDDAVWQDINKIMTSERIFESKYDQSRQKRAEKCITRVYQWVYKQIYAATASIFNIIKAITWKNTHYYYDNHSFSVRDYVG